MERTMRQTRSIPEKFNTRDDGGEKRVEGYFAVFDGEYQLWDGATESVDRNAFESELSGDVRCLVDHDTRLVLGRTSAGTLTLRTDDHGLWGSVLINPEDSDAMNLYARVQRGDVNQCSFGFDILDEEFEDRGNGSVHWTIKKVKLYEVSCVTFPAYESTSVSARQDDLKNIRKRETDAWRQRMLAKLSPTKKE